MVNKIKKLEEPALPQIRNCFSPRVQVAARIGGASRTKQSFKKETDLNYLIARYQKTGQLPRMPERTPQFGYAPSVDFQEALQLVESAKNNFQQLPSHVRERFQNDPASFLAFVENPENAPKFAEYGLAEAKTPANPPSDGKNPAESGTVTPSSSVTVPTDTKSTNQEQ